MSTANRETLHRHSRIFSLPYPISENLRFPPSPTAGIFSEFSTAADLYDAIGLLREGVMRRGSKFKIEGIGRTRFNDTLDWLAECGYAVDSLYVPVRTKARQR